MKKRIKIGDIIEIQTALGRVYAQFYQKHEASAATSQTSMGAIVRILPGFFHERLTDFGELAAAKEIFSTFFCVQAAVNRDIVQLVGHAEVPPHARRFPVFRTGFSHRDTGKVDQWSLWDGVKQWQVGKLTDEQLDFPIRGIPSYPLLVERLETGWTPRRADEFIDMARAKLKLQNVTLATERKIEEVRHYLIFEDRSISEEALHQILDLGMKADMTELENNWGINVLQPNLSPEEIEKIAGQLEDLAEALGGTYDGNQVKLGNA